MAHDRGDFIVGQLQLIDQPAVENDFATRAAVGIELITLDQVDFPIPLRRIGAKLRCLGNQPIGDHLYALGLGAALVQHALARGFSERLLIRLRIHLVDLLGRQHAEHVLLALHTHRATAGGIDRLATSEQYAGTQDTDDK
ncbi:hypothetical protein D3C85_949290 [compost metagenome]